METVKEELILKVTPGSRGKGVEGHLVIQNGAIIKWNYTKPFYIQFDKGNNPCQPSSYKDPDIYPSIEGSEEGMSQFEVKCNVITTRKAWSYPYGIHSGQPPQDYLAGGAGGEDSHCKGCCLETM